MSITLPPWDLIDFSPQSFFHDWVPSRTLGYTMQYIYLMKYELWIQ